MVTIIRPGNRLLVPGANVQHGRAVAGGGGDWWDYSGVVAAYDAKNASSLANSYVNLANPGTYDAAPGVAPAWSGGTGWTFNGTNDYLLTGITPASDWSMFVTFSNAANTGSRILVGQQKSGDTDRFYLSSYFSADGLLYGSGSSLRVIPSLTNGTIGVIANKGWRNGTEEPGTISDWTDAADYALYIGAHNLDNSASFYYDGDIIAVWIGSSTLSSGDASSLSTAMAAL